MLYTAWALLITILNPFQLNSYSPDANNHKLFKLQLQCDKTL